VEKYAFFDDDDVSLPNRVEEQYKRISDYQSLVGKDAPILCYTAREQKYPDGTVYVEQTTGIESGEAPHGKAVAYKILTGKPTQQFFGAMATCSQMAPVSLLKRLGGFDEAFKRSEDTEFNVRAAVQNTHFVGIAEPLVVQTMTRGNDKPLALERQCAVMMLDKHAALVQQAMDVNFCKKWINLRYDFWEGDKIKFGKNFLSLVFRYPILTLKRVLWAFPNIGFNARFIKFYKGTDS